MRRNKSRLLSGVNNSFITDNNLHDLVSTFMFEAVSNFKVTVDFPLNNGGIISTMRPARARNNYGLKLDEFHRNGTLYKEIVSYGTGSGATSVGTTSITNYLMSFTAQMNDLRNQVFSILHNYQYLAPFVKEFSHCQISINGNKGLERNKTCNTTQTGMHCDTVYSFHKTHGIVCPLNINSQATNSIVAIITVGHSRVITFERVACNSDPGNNILERRYFILSHGSLFILHPLDERPALRDRGSGSYTLSYWRHGGVRLLCNNPECKEKCTEACHDANEYACSFSLAFRTCVHKRVIDASTNVDPISDEDRSHLHLSPLTDLQKEKNEISLHMLHEYNTNGD
eukprot:CAMPEP_0113437258 /NCGR_PEP_ID=MMETSP0013_2-20120614/37322_1 /TAXON_ID=2843 ORGANISM="Skeletonema costatum, Strain 1716" /NCGR_SAMPLE_ID=MMETSP0013_2 /ASSEMBLY_ACC=CAM_ASM_000158 /LENGTH=341 /DNA_ID=CAMNT_0000327905 /DNA_START=154 /DNA_END=1176 /DNA_ORIENTATION=- /assembly_acc=CAM_ASM_000158